MTQHRYSPTHFRNILHIHQNQSQVVCRQEFVNHPHCQEMYQSLMLFAEMPVSVLARLDIEPAEKLACQPVKPSIERYTTFFIAGCLDSQNPAPINRNSLKLVFWLGKSPGVQVDKTGTCDQEFHIINLLLKLHMA